MLMWVLLRACVQAFQYVLELIYKSVLLLYAFACSSFVVFIIISPEDMSI